MRIRCGSVSISSTVGFLVRNVDMTPVSERGITYRASKSPVARGITIECVKSVALSVRKRGVLFIVTSFILTCMVDNRLRERSGISIT